MDWKLFWPKGEPNSNIVEKTKADIAECLADLERAEDLVFHTVFLTDDYVNGPVVMVDGHKGDDRLHCWYYGS